MKIAMQKRLASKVAGVSPKRIRLDTTKMAEIKEAITRVDVKSLINQGLIRIKPARSPSRVRSRARRIKLRKGRQRGQGTRKGKRTARAPKKEVWAARIRLQRAFIKDLKRKGHIDAKTYRGLYMKAKGGFFRSKRHLKLYVEDRGMISK